MDVKRNELIMMQRRGYDITKAYLYDDAEVIPFSGGLNELSLQTLISTYPNNLSMVYPKGNTRAVVLYLPITKGKTRKEAMTIVTEAINQTLDGRPMFNEFVFFSAELTPSTRKDLSELRINSTMFTYLEMSLDIFAHVSAPISVKWWTSAESFYADEEIKESELSQIKVDDPYIRRLGLKRGYIVMAVLPSITGESVVDYRVVV